MLISSNNARNYQIIHNKTQNYTVLTSLVWKVALNPYPIKNVIILKGILPK